jgi:hypothetical protein
MLGARYLYFKRNAEKFGVRVIRKVRAIGRKIWYLPSAYKMQFEFRSHFSGEKVRLIDGKCGKSVVQPVHIIGHFYYD